MKNLMMQLLAAFFTLAVALTSARASAEPIMLDPVHSFSAPPAVADRETVAAVAVRDGRLAFLLTDRAATGRSAILVETDFDGVERRRVDLGSPAQGLASGADFLFALSSHREGMRALIPSDHGAQGIELAGITAQSAGMGSRLVRVLGSGDLAIHEASATEIGPEHILATAAQLKTPDACATCGPQRIVAQGAHVALLLTENLLAVVHRSSAVLKVIDLDASTTVASVTLDSEELRRGRAMYARQQESFPASASRTSHPSLIVGGTAHSSGDMLLLVGPFTPPEGARIVRISADGAVVHSLRCLYPAFNPNDGPPQFVASDGDNLLLITQPGRVNSYQLPSRIAGL